eukprot:gene7776-9123_t
MRWEYGWAKDWTHMMTFQSEGKIFLFSYKHGKGNVAVDLLTPETSEEVYKEKWASDWKSFTILNHFEGHKLVLQSSKPGVTAYDELLADGRLREIKRVVTPI